MVNLMSVKMPDKKKSSEVSQVVLVFLLTTLLCPLALAMNITDGDLVKLDPVLKPIVLEQEYSISTGRPLRIAPVIMACSHEPGFVNTIIKVTGNPMSVESAGAKVRSVVDYIVTADVPIQSLSALIRLPNVVYVQAAHRMKTSMLDVSVPETKANQVWESAPGFTGKGVIVGVVDTGIDWSHPDFMGADGKSRILYTWDQTMPTSQKHPAGYSYGIEWTKAQIDAGQCLEMDTVGHGTHVSSIIAGDGRGRHQFTGMAPDANIILVKSYLGNADVIDAVSYIFAKAAALNRPVVINMSFGSQTGPHDGTELLDQALDVLLGRSGRAIVASAGNEGGIPIHVGTSSLRNPSGGNYPWTAIYPFVGAELVEVQVWYKPSASISVRLLLPENDNGDLGDPGIGWVSKGRSSVFNVSSGPLAGAQVIVDAQQVASRRAYPNFNNVTILISDNGDPNIRVDNYIYAIEYDGAGVGIDAYIPGEAVFTTKLPTSVSFPNGSFLLGGDGNNTIGSPASASNVISVSSYTTKSEWIDEENRIRIDEQVKIDNISAFSSLGPLLNGETKPEIAAPGEYIVAALSSESWQKPSLIYRDDDHVAFRGTSMASPHVTGAVALIYQQNPSSNALEVKKALTDTAIDMGPSGWDKAWGYGKINILGAMDIPNAPRGLEAEPTNGSVTVKWLANDETDLAGYRIYVNPGNLTEAGKVTSYQLVNLANGNPVTLSVSAYNTSGKEGPRTDEITVTPNPPQTNIAPPRPPQGLSITPVDTGLSLKWQQNSEYNLGGYKIYYGVSSGNYSKVITVDSVTTYNIEGLTNGVRIYLAITAYDTSGRESSKSDEVSAIPQLFPLPELHYHTGWPVKMNDDVFSSPAIHDVNGDGRMEVAITSRDGKVSLLSYNGSYMPGWPVLTDGVSVSSPALCDVDGDDEADVVVGAGGSVYAWHFNGTSIPGWPVKTGGNIFASPAVGDISGDGKNEVVIGSLDGKVYAFRSDGSHLDGWPASTADSIYSSAAVGDIDGDGGNEVVIGSMDGKVYAFKGNGSNVDGWPIDTKSQVQSSPVLGDIDRDGKFEIIANTVDGVIYVWDSGGSLVPGWPVNLNNSVASSPAIGDIDNDKQSLEIVICTLDGLVFVLKNDGTIANGWPAAVTDSITTSPALADVNGNGDIEIIVSASASEEDAGLVYAFTNAGEKLGEEWPVYTAGDILNSSPAISDLNGDGNVELVIGSCRLSDGTGGQIHAWNLASRLTSQSVLWGEFRYDSYHTGFVGIKKPEIAVENSELPPFFNIKALQAGEYLNISIVASKPLTAPPELTVEVGGVTQRITLQQAKAPSYTYRADYAIGSSGLYTLTVVGTDRNGNVGRCSKTIQVQKTDYSLLQNYPNPFNPGTWIPYELRQPEKVTIEIYNAAGQLIRTLNLGIQAAGSHTSKENAAYWDGKDDNVQKAASGLYFYTLRAGQFAAVRKMVLAE
jgi:subtilisin family serine protease